MGKNALKYFLFPIKLLKKFSISRFCNLFHYIQQEGLKGTKKRLLECVFGTELYHRELVTKKVKQITSLESCAKLKFPYQETPLVSIIIPVYNEFSMTYSCLQSILHAGDTTAYEIIIADDCSNDFTQQLNEVTENIVVCRTDKNLRFLKNCNHAAKRARGKYLFFLNNDTQVQAGWLDMQVKLMEDDETVGMTGAKLVYPDGRLQEAGGIIWNNAAAWNYGNRQNPDLPEYNYIKEADYISGAAIMIRSTLWKQIGGFDEEFAPAYCEDSDLAFEVRKAGYKVLYQPGSVVIHFEGLSNGTDTHEGLKQFQKINQKKLYKKWKTELSNHYPEGENVFYARERSQEKKILLMIDHYAPTFDCDAGSRTVYQFLQLFVKKGFQVKFIGDNFRYHEVYTQALEQLGIEVLYGEYYQNRIFEWLDANHQYIDYVFLNRPHISIKYIDYFRQKTKCRILYYGHDFHYLRNKREYELSGNKNKLKEAEEWLEKELYLIRNADMSYYPSPVEEREILKIDSGLRVKTITAYTFADFNPLPVLNFSEREGLLFVGGFVHSPNQDAVIWFANNIYPLIRKVKKIPLYIVGSYPTLEIKNLQKIRGITVRGFVSDEELETLYHSCRLAIVPLRYGAGIKGKVVEALYYGLPVVTTSIGAEGIPELEKAAYIEDQEENFSQAILELYDKEQQLRQMSQAAQQLVCNYFSMDAVWKTLSPEFI